MVFFLIFLMRAVDVTTGPAASSSGTWDGKCPDQNAAQVCLASGKVRGAWPGQYNHHVCTTSPPQPHATPPTGFASKLRAAAPPSAARGELRTRGRKNGNKKAGGGPGAAEGGGAGVLRAGPGGGPPSRQGGGGGGRVRGLVCPGCAVSRCDVIMTSPWLTAALAARPCATNLRLISAAWWHTWHTPPFIASCVPQ